MTTLFSKTASLVLSLVVVVHARVLVVVRLAAPSYFFATVFPISL